MRARDAAVMPTAYVSKRTAAAGTSYRKKHVSSRRTFEEGFTEGWRKVLGQHEPVGNRMPRYRDTGDDTAYNKGLERGVADALEEKRRRIPQ
jgi:hypothetical protein